MIAGIAAMSVNYARMSNSFLQYRLLRHTSMPPPATITSISLFNQSDTTDLVVFVDRIPDSLDKNVTTALLTVDPAELRKIGRFNNFTYLISFSQFSDIIVDFSYAYDVAWEQLQTGNFSKRASISVDSQCDAEPRLSMLQGLINTGLVPDLVMAGACYNSTPKSGPFCFAFEHSIVTDFVTEELIKCIASGSVPVYMGAPNFAEIVGPEIASFVVDAVTMYNTASDLAAHLVWMLYEDNVFEETAYFRTHQRQAAWIEEFRNMSRAGVAAKYRARDLFATGANSWLSRLEHIVMPR